MYDQDWCLRPSTRLFRYSMTIFTIVTLTALFFVSVLAQAPTRDTRSWTDPGGSGLTITFSTPKTYESCTSASDRIFTSGIPDNWSLLGAVDVYWATTTGAEKISSIPVRQNGNLDLTIPYPPSSTWPDLTSIGNPLRELHIVVGILVRDQTGTEVSWVGGDLVNAPGILGAGGQVWDVICLPTGATPTPTNTPISQLGSLGDRVWRDDNGNGIQDNGEPGIPGASVVLLDCSGNTLTSSSTNASGNYLFGNLNAGCYVVQFDPVSGLSYSPANQGADDTKDSDANPAGGRTGPINLGQGENNPTVDAGFVPPSPAGSLGDRVWRDDNSNGIQDSGEPGVPGVTVQLKDCNNNVLRTTTTDGNGNYSFTGLAAGCYRVGVVPSGFTISPVNQGTDDTRDSDVDPATAMTGNINLAQGENNPTVDAGLIPPLGSIGNRVWNDVNQNGIQDTGEVGIPNVPVQLKDCNGNIIRTRNTDSNGNYGFNNLAAGCYIIGVVVPSGFQISPKGQGGDGARDSDIDPTTAMSDPVNLAAGQNIFTIDAGLFQPPVNGSLGDRVWRDDNSNGIQDPNEPGVSGVTVQLKDCNNNVLRTATTDGNGNYSFTGLAAGCYRVGIVPSGFTISPVNQGTDDTRDSDVDPATAMTGNINLAQGENNPTVDAGLIPPQPNLGSLGDRLWRDDNRNGVQDSGEPGVPGVTVQLKDCNNNVLRTTTTDGNGNYSFTGLAAGCYVVRFANINSNLFAFTTPDQGGDDTRDSDVTQLDSVTPGIINGQTEPITLAQGQNNPTIDAGLITPQPNLGSLGDRVWRDDNSNGIQDSGEPGVPGVTVQLKDCNNNVLRTATTDGNGNYSFTGLAAGCYRVGVVPNGFTISPVNQGTDDTRDSDVDPATAMTGNINLAQGENNPTVDAGLIPPQPNLGSIGDRVFNDTNRDGIQNAGEPGVPGVTVQLKDCNNNVLRTTATDNNGIYGFTGLAAGCYRIGILPNGFTISPANQGTDDTRDSDVDPATAMTGNINLAQGENNPTIDAGVFTPQPVGSIGDRVFDDLNSNGIQDNGEPGVPNVTVQLKDCNNNVLRTATTDGSGNYLFNNLNAGCYTVGVVLPIGREFTSANQGTDDARDSDIDPATGMTGPINLDPGENDLTNDAGLRAPLACGLTVDQKCQVAGPPPSSNFTCSDAKPLNELSMVWNGSQRVDVRAWKGSVGSTLLATITNVAPGQIVNVTGYAGAPNDVIWEVFAAGTTSKLGESTFHLSCSDRNMDGPEDCGTAQGDGKDRTGFLNSWKLEGMGGNGIRFTCSSTPPTPTDSCTVISSGGSVCNGSKPKSLTFRYTGGSCANSTNPQSGKATCSGSPGTGTVTIAATGKDASKISITPSSVNPGQEVTLTSTDGKGFPSDTRLQVGGQALAIHTSCSQALNLGDVFGSLVLVGADGKRLDTPVTFTYLVANSGDALSNVSLEDDFGSVTAPFSLARGASQSFQRQTTIGETTTNTAFVRGVLANGQQCEDSDDTTVVIEPPALSCQDGKPIALTFEYTGGSCSDTTNSQNGKLLCSGSPGTDPVSIAITGKDADKVAVRPSSVSRGQRFTMSRTDGREFAADTLLRVGGQSLSIHTSCSQQLNVGDVFGSLRLVVFTPKGFPIPASADGGANQTFLPLIARQ